MAYNTCGSHYGKRYQIIYDKLGNQQACDDEYHNSWFYFLWVGGDYIGHYKTMKEAMDHI